MGEGKSLDYLGELTLRNRARLLSMQMDEKKRAQLLAMSFVVENLGTNPLDVAFRLLYEQAVLFYILGEVDRLHIMGVTGAFSDQREGNA